MDKVKSLKLSDQTYPSLLRSIDNPPKQLFWQGTAINSWLEKPKVAIVGSRKVSGYGRQVTTKFAYELARQGVVVISGLALGVDSIAHQAALKAGGITVAILPTSLEQIYPASHAGLARQIINSGGSLISEYKPSDPIYKVNFTARNRIITGLSDIVLITEASLKSGTLTTARYALEQGRTVMAVPGNITSLTSEGTNNLIKSGAAPATKLDDILFELGYKPSRQTRTVFRGSPEEEAIFKLIESGTSSQEELALKASLSAAAVASALTALELAGQVKAAGSGHWILS